MLKRKQAWIALSILLIASTAFAQDNASQKPTKQVDSPAAASGAGKSATDDPNYVIGAQDVLDISVWREPDASRSALPVRPDGKISLPLLNDVQAAGLTPTQLMTQITAGLDKYFKDPQVTVIVTQVNSQRIYITGEVNRAGQYPMIPGMTVLQALSSAGGFTQYANSKKIYVLRQENGKANKLYFNYKDVVAGKEIKQNIEMKSGDTIVVP